jgi:Spherulation-specific family 4
MTLPLDAAEMLFPPPGYLIPMYVYPANIPDGARGADEWEACTGSQPDERVTYVIANVANGVADPASRRAPGGGAGPGDCSASEEPGWCLESADRTDPNYRRAISECAARGARLLGYVNTQHGTAPLGSAHSTDPGTVLGQVHLWFELYPGIEGVFFDQVSTAGNRSDRLYYESISGRVPGTVIANPGQLPSSDWLLQTGADLVVYENDVAGFASFRPPTWMADYPPGRFAAILHDVGSPEEVSEVCLEARRRGFGFVYVTDGRQSTGNPYDGLPSEPIWTALEASSRGWSDRERSAGVAVRR